MGPFWMEAAVAVTALLTHEFILAAAVLIACASADDLVVDAIYFIRRAWRSATIYQRHPRVSADMLALPEPPGAMAIFVPAWDEAAVIGDMLRGALRRFDHPHFRIFVGLYPNDPATAEAVRRIADPRVIPVITSRGGPTTKADCLNHLWDALTAEERATGTRFKAVILHDAEDVVHSMELRIFDRLIDRFDMVQLPVLPLPDPHSRWIAGHYLDEFAESHGKDLVVREALGASVPSAGVGCAINRNMMDRIILMNGSRPFDEDSVTEDYELGLKIGALGGKGIIVRMPAGTGNVVATREHFPATLETAVRQKTRWLTGIALHGWDRMGWRGGMAERWMRLRDRKSIVCALATVFAYAGALGWGLVSLAQYVWPWMTLPAVVAPGGWLALLLKINTAMLCWRLAMRCAFTTAAYGFAEGLRAIPRVVIANLIAILACFRALVRIVSALGKPERRPVWDKTAHRFPIVLPGE